MQSALIPSFVYTSYFHQLFSAKVPEQIRKLLAQGIFQIEQWDFNLVIPLNDQHNTLKPLCGHTSYTAKSGLPWVQNPNDNQPAPAVKAVWANEYYSRVMVHHLQLLRHRLMREEKSWPRNRFICQTVSF